MTVQAAKLQLLTPLGYAVESCECPRLPQCVGIVDGFERLRFRTFVSPGDQLRLEVEITDRDASRASVKGRAFRGDQVVTSAEFTLAMRPAEPITAAQSAHLYGVLRLQANGEKSIVKN